MTGRLKEQYKLENGKYVVPGPIEEVLCRAHFISQALVYGDHKPHNVALIVPDFAEVKAYCVKRNIPVPESLQELMAHDRVIKHMSKEVCVHVGYP